MEFLTASVTVTADGTQLYASLNQLKSQTTNAVGDIEKKASGIGRAFQTAYQTAVHWAKWGAAGITAAFVVGMKSFADFEVGLANIGAEMGKQAGQYMPQYEESIKNLAVQFGISTSALVKGLDAILDAGIAPSKALAMLETSSRAAVGGLTDVSSTANNLTGIMNAYGYSTRDAAKVSDILFAGVRGGKADFAELGSTISRIAPITAGMGVSLEEVTAALATITRNGASTQQAMASLRSALFSLQNPSAAQISLARQFGVELSTSSLRTKGLVGVIQELAQLSPSVLAGITSEGRARVALNSLIKDSAGFTRDYNAAMSAAGTTQEFFEAQSNTLTMSLKKMWESIKMIGLELGGVLAPIIKTVAEGFKEWLSANRTEFALAFVTTIESITDAVLALTEMMQGLIDKIEYIPKRLATIPQFFRGMNAAIQGGIDWWTSPSATLGNLGSFVRSAQDEAEEVAKVEAQSTGTRTKLHEAFDQVRDKIHRAEMLRKDEELNKMNEFANSWLETTDRTVKATNVMEEEQLKTSIWITQQMEEGYRSCFDKITSGLSGVIEGLMTGTMTLTQAMQSMFQSITTAIVQMIAQMIAKMMMLWFLQTALGLSPGTLNMLGFGVGAAGGGGGGMEVPEGHRGISADYIPKLHAGLRSDEFPAILQRGEAVIPKGQGSQGGTIVFNVSAIDGENTFSFLKKNRGTIASMMQRTSSENHPYRRGIS